MLIDAHQHLWRLSRGDYAWLTPALAPIHRDFGPADLRPLLEDAGIGGTILVQAAPTIAETRHLLGVADANPFVRGVVGWVDFESPDALADLDALERHPRLRGLRPMLHDIADPEWILRPAFTPILEDLIVRDLAFDALIRPAHIPVIERLLQRHPGLRVVVDHGAKPDIAGGGWQPWADAMRTLAATTGAHVKLSGLLTEAGPGARFADVRSYALHLLGVFGPERTMWGSDWPVLLLAGDYRAWFDACRALVAGLGAAAVAQVFGGTAARFYRLEGA